MPHRHHIDPERLAALLDGRLGDADAAEVRTLLAAADDETLGAYADAIAAARELASDAPIVSSDVSVISLEQRRMRRWRTPAIAVVAAAAIVVVVFRTVVSPETYSPMAYARAIPDRATLATGSVWSASRGAREELSERSRAARVGALLTDLELDALRGAPAREHAGALAELLEAMPGGAPAAAPLRQIAEHAGSVISMQRSHDVGQSVFATVSAPFADAGAYLEAARLAAASGDVAKFLDAAPPLALKKARSVASLDSVTAAALGKVISLAHARPRDEAAFRSAVDEALRGLTR